MIHHHVRRVGLTLLAIISLTLARPAHAQDCAASADRLRAHLEQADVSVSRWQLAWTIVFGTAAAASATLAIAEYKPFGEFDDKYRDTLWVSSAKATIGLASRVILPLRVHIPDRSADRCVELAQLRESVTKLGRKERDSFWLTHLGGTALNLAGGLLLWHRHTLATGAVSFAISYPVGITSAYTLPRKTWHLWREEKLTWTVGVVPSSAGTLFVLGGTF